MVRTAVVQLVLFVAVVGAATLFAGVLVTQSGLYAQSTGDAADRSAAAVDADLEIVADAESNAIHDGGTLTLYVRNVGGRTLEPAALDLLVDGEYVADPSMRVLEADHGRWRPGTTLEVEATVDLEAGDHRALVALDGARDLLEFDVAAD